MALFLACSCIVSAEEVPMSKAVFKYLYWLLPQSYDPYLSDSFSSMPVAKNIYAPLVSTFMDGKPQGMIAESWEMSQDGKVWRFKIRKGLKFPDGTPITSEVVLKNFRRILWLTKASGLALNRAMPEVVKWEDYSLPLKCLSTDGDNVVFKFAAPPENLFEDLEKPLFGIANPVCFDQEGKWLDGGCLYESGQYKIEKRLPGSIILRNRHVFPEVENAPETIEFIANIFSSKPWLEWGLENKVDLMLNSTLSLGRAELDMITEAGYKVLNEPPLRMHYLRLNHRRPPFSDKALRQAIRDSFLYYLGHDPNFSELRLDPSFIPPGGMGYFPIKTPGKPGKQINMQGVTVKVLMHPIKPLDNPVSKSDKYKKALETALYKTMERYNIKLDISRDHSKTYELTKSGHFDVMFKYSGLSVQEPYEALRMMFMSDVGACIPDPSGLIPGYILKGVDSKTADGRRHYAEKINQTIYDDAAAITFTHSGFVYVYAPSVDVSRMSIFSDPIEFRAVAAGAK